MNPGQYGRAIRESRRLGVTLSFAELAHFGCTHTQAGALLARKWHLDDCLLHVIERHHHREALEKTPFTLVAAIANNLSKQAGAGESGNPVVEEYADDLARSSAITDDVRVQICTLLPVELEKAASFLSLVQEQRPS
jgi:HD-like signal output (HDOD) protein